MSSVRFATLLLTLAHAASASSVRTPACLAQEPAIPASSWPAPLDRIITFHASDISLKDALDRLAAQAHFRVSYSGEFVPLDRQVCLAADSTSLGTVLETLLAGTGVEPVVAGADYVVLTPPKSPIADAARPIMLDRIVVTGTATGGSQRPLPVALDVLDAQDLRRQSINSLSDAISATVPGEFLWASSPTSLMAQYGSIRGASSLGLSYPKVYIDGIEVANPLLLTRFSPDAIEKVEVIRGPQGAALYGADAISGITNIVSRQDAAQEGEPRVRWQSDVGAATSDFVTNPTLRQSHALSYRTGAGSTTGGLNLSYGSDGAFVPGAYARAFNALGNIRAVSSDVIWTGIVRFFDEQAASPVSPLLLDSVQPGGLRITSPGTQSVVQYTAGTTLKYMPSDEWKHTFTVGVDGYSLDGLPDDGTPFPSAADSALLAARGSALRATLRASSVLAMDLGPRANGDITLSLEQSELRQAITTDLTQPASGSGSNRSRGGPPRSYQTPAGVDSVDWRSNTAVTGLMSTGIANHLFVSGGVRLEQATGVDGTVIPMLGVAWVNEVGPATLKLRAAYGKGVRFPSTTPRQAMYEDIRSGLAALAAARRAVGHRGRHGPHRGPGAHGPGDAVRSDGNRLDSTRRHDARHVKHADGIRTGRGALAADVHAIAERG
jgi:iron complex outermembrane receptor protein